MNNEYVEPTQQNKKKAKHITISKILIFLIIFALWTPFFSYIDSKPLCEQVLWFQGIIVLVGLYLFFLYCLYIGRVIKLSKYNQIPLPTDVFTTRQRVYRDWRVKLQQASLMFILAILTAGYIWVSTTPTIQIIFSHQQQCENA